jgi:hypothetical protein
MKKIICMLAAMALFLGGALAENALEFGGDIYIIAREPDGSALVRFEGGEKPLLSERGAELRDLTVFNGAMYYLRLGGNGWELVCRNPSGGVHTAYEFPRGTQTSGLSAYGQNLFALVDGQLHMIYPDQDLCLKLAGAVMEEYVIVDDCAYFISGSDKTAYSMAYPGGKASREAGGVYRLNLSTGDIQPLIKSGAYDLSYAAGRLYFHSLADGYVAAAGGQAEMCGRLCSWDLASGALFQECADYDWGYLATQSGPAIRNADGLWLGGEIIAALSDTDEICVINEKLAAFDPLNVTIKFLQ